MGSRSGSKAPGLRTLGPLAGLAGVLVYVLFANAAYASWPGSFGPLTNWLSDLGSAALNPGGAWLYGAAAVLGGALLLPFFLSFPGSERRGSPARLHRVLAGVFGSAASVFFALTGLFPEDVMPMHSWFSIANFAAFGTAAAFTGIAILRGARLPRWLAVLCFATWGVDVLSAVLSQARFLEWVLVGMLILFVCAVSACTLAGPARRPGRIVVSRKDPL